MAEASGSAIAMLLFCLFIGPLIWAIIKAVERFRKTGPVTQSVPEDPMPEKAEIVEEREQTDSLSYLLSLLGYAIGIGNLWRFPYLVGKFGGGAFIVAYLVCLVFVAAPCYLIEMVMGSYTQENTIDCFRTIKPRWVGLGWGQCVMLFFILSYYNVVLAYSVVYICSSLIDPFPWAESSASYWKEDVLNNYGGDYDGKSLGAPQWKLVVALLAVWVIVFFSLSFGKAALAKVTWVTVLGPVFLLVILVIRTAVLDGASDGVEFYIGKFDGDVLGDLSVWTTACGQIIFSLSPGMGTAVTLSSRTEPKTNVFKTCMLVAFCNSAFSLIGGFAIFSIIGNITYKLNENGGILDEITGVMRLTTVKEQARAGPGLAFIAIADGMKHFGDGQHVMAVLFFMMLLTLGLDSTFAWAETFVTYVEDYSRNRGFTIAKWKIVGAVSCVLFLFGLPFCTRMGNELLDTVDHFVAAYYLLLGCGLEALMFSADFTWRRLSVSVWESTNDSPFWRQVFRFTEPVFFFAVTVATPIMSFGLFLYMLVQDLEIPYEGYPDELLAVGWIVLFVCILATVAGPWKYFATFGVSAGNSTLPALEDQVPAGDPELLGKPQVPTIIAV